MRLLLAFLFVVACATAASAQNKTAGNIGIWSNNPPNSMADTGNAIAPGNFTVNGNLAVHGTVTGIPLGNVVGPASSGVLRPALFNNTAGTLLVDGVAAMETPFANARTSMYSGTLADATYVSVLGTHTAPNNTVNASAIFTKVTNGYAVGSMANPAVYVASTKIGSQDGWRTVGLMSEGLDEGGGWGFVEGARFHGSIGPGGANAQADGIVCLAQSAPGVHYTFLVGCEGTVERRDFDAPPIFNRDHYSVAFIATNAQDPASKISDAGFLVNPWNDHPYRVGFLNAGSGSSDAAFRSVGPTIYGLDLSSATISYAAIALPDDKPIRVAGLNVLYGEAANEALVLGTDTHGITLPITNPPPSGPGHGFFDLFVGADNALYAKAPSVTATLASTTAAFKAYGSVSYGLDLSSVTASYAAIDLPNIAPLRVDTLNVLYGDTTTHALILGTDTHGITLPRTGAAPVPATGYFNIYVDNDGALYAKGPNGTTTQLAPP